MTELRFDLGFRFPNLIMHFNRFDLDDPARCIFVESANPFDLDDENTEFPWRPVLIPADGSHNAMLKALGVARQWGSLLELYIDARPARGGADGFDLPSHIIRVKSVVNDTELPGLRVDFVKKEVSFSWLDMFDRLFREEQALEKGLERWNYEVRCHTASVTDTQLISNSTRPLRREMIQKSWLP